MVSVSCLDCTITAQNGFWPGMRFAQLWKRDFRILRYAAPNAAESADQGVYTQAFQGYTPLSLWGIHPLAYGVYTLGLRGCTLFGTGGVHPLAQGVYTFHPLNSTSKQHSSSFCSIVGRPEARRCPKISFRRKPYLHKNAAIRQILTPQAENTLVFAPFSLGSAKMPRSVRPGCISGASPKPRPLFCQSRRICRAARQRAFYNCDN